MSEDIETVEATDAAERAAAVARQEEERAEQAARAASADHRVAYFDADGVCQLIQTGDASPPDDFAFAARVVRGVTANDVRFNPETLRVNKSKAPTVSIPDAIPAGEPFSIDLPDGVVAEVDGERHTGTLSIDTSDVGRKVLVEIHGAQRGSFVAEVQSYAEARRDAYAPIPEQLDMLYHDPDAWRAHIAAVKAAHPKPETITE